MYPALILIPVTLGDTEHRRVLPDFNSDAIRPLTHYIVENVRTARRFLKKCDPSIDIDALTFYELNKHTRPEAIASYLHPLEEGQSVGLLSEAGCPAIADPGADVVAMAQRRGYRVIPLVGPSSLLMALMASGFNGQSFAFHGYLPVDEPARSAAIKALEARVHTERQTQLFIETPYRNEKMMADLIRVCRPSTRLCIATSITCDDETIQTLSIGEWKQRHRPDLNKRPTIFLLGN